MKNKSADGLRGFAALNVLLAHFCGAFQPQLLHNNYPEVFQENSSASVFENLLTTPIISIFFNGHLAVLIFFALSGYVLTLPYFDGRQNPEQALLKRLIGRYFRLNIPIIFAVAISFLIYYFHFYRNFAVGEISGSSWFQLFYKDNLNFLIAIKEAIYRSIVFGDAGFVPPLWTLRIEFIGSVYLLIFYILKPQKYLSFYILLSASIIYLLHKQDSIYYYTIFAGSLIYFLKRFEKYKLVLFMFGFYFGAYQENSIFYQFLPTISFSGHEIWEKKNIYNAAGAILMTTAVIHNFGFEIFQSKVAQFLARVSFSSYLLHFMILSSFTSMMYLALPKDHLNLIITLFAYLGMCYLLSAVFEKYIDRTSINIAHGFVELTNKYRHKIFKR